MTTIAAAALNWSPASAADDGCVADRRTGEIVCRVTGEDPGGGGRGGPPVTQPAVGDVLWWPVLVWDTDAGRTCVEFRREVFAGAAASQRAEEAEARMLSLLRSWPPCTTTPAPAVAVPFIVREYIERVGLPTPDPRIAPGYALAGKPAYLETRSTLRPSPFTADTPVGPIQVSARGTYVVDWGDGTPTQTYTLEGGPWPEGRITHVYTDVGTYPVRVEVTWVASWTAATASGTATGITTSASLPAFEVRELQAVRRR